MVSSLQKHLIIKDKGWSRLVETVHILLADRNRHVRELLRRELETEGYLVTVARDAQEILGLLAQGKIPDLLILDLEIPYLTEVNLLEQLQATHPTLPIIIHSFQPENPNEFIMPNTVAFLEKAADPNQLKTTIAALVHK
jgi:DNA-binding NtrC family response regulator